MAQPGDADLSCAALKDQIAANEAAAQDFVRQDRQVKQGNVTKVIVSAAIPYVGLLLAGSYNLSNEEQIKGRALVDRDEHLKFLAKKRGCKYDQGEP